MKKLREQCLFELNYLLKEFEKYFIKKRSYELALTELLAISEVNNNETFIEEIDLIKAELRKTEERAEVVRRMTVDSLTRLETTLIEKVSYEDYNTIEEYLKYKFDFEVDKLTEAEQREITFDILEIKLTNQEIDRKLEFLKNSLTMSKTLIDKFLLH